MTHGRRDGRPGVPCAALFAGPAASDTDLPTEAILESLFLHLG